MTTPIIKFAKKLFLFCFCTGFLISAHAQRNAQISNSDDNNWSGTITYIATQVNHHAGPYSDFIYKKWDHFYEQQMEATLSDGKGIAKSTITLTDTSYNREETGSRIVEQWVKENGNAQGISNTEVSVTINQQNKTYSIEVPIPETTGSKTKTFSCNGCGQASPDPITTGMGEDETSIMIEDEKLGNNQNVLSGEKTERKKIDNGEGEEIIVTRWKLVKGRK